MKLPQAPPKFTRDRLHKVANALSTHRITPEVGGEYLHWDDLRRRNLMQNRGGDGGNMRCNWVLGLGIALSQLAGCGELEGRPTDIGDRAAPPSAALISEVRTLAAQKNIIG